MLFRHVSDTADDRDGGLDERIRRSHRTLGSVKQSRGLRTRTRVSSGPLVFVDARGQSVGTERVLTHSIRSRSPSHKAQLGAATTFGSHIILISS